VKEVRERKTYSKLEAKNGWRDGGQVEIE